MNYLRLTFLLSALLVLASCGGDEKSETTNSDSDQTTTQDANTYAVQANSTAYKWVGTKPGEFHHGTVGVGEGSISVTDGMVSGGTLSIDMSQLAVLDGSAKEKEDLGGHLTSPDFLDVANHPSATITINSVTEGAEAIELSDEGIAAVLGAWTKDPTHTVNATLTVKGSDSKISFPANLEVSDNEVRGMGVVKLQRSEHGLRFMSDSDAKVGQDMYLGVQLTASK